MPPVSALRNKHIAKFLTVSSQYFNLPGLLRSLLVAGSIGASMGGAAMASEQCEAEPTANECADRACRADLAGVTAPAPDSAP